MLSGTVVTGMVLDAGYLTHKVTRSSNVVLITLDTTRADHLSVYGMMDVSMPHLDRLAREGVVFDRATSVAPLTLPAHSSLFTGLFPWRHGVRTNGDVPLPSQHTTLAEILQQRGFRTGAFVGSVVLDPDRGLAQGFDRYGAVAADAVSAAPPGQRRGDEVVAEATQWLEEVAGSPFFLWAHLYDAHRPYDPPGAFRALHPGHPYLGEIAFLDSQIGRLVEALERRRVWDRTIVIVAGDHGESLGEHGERDHGIFVYESVLRVPLIIRAPALSQRRVATVVRLVDVMPTILDLLEIPPMEMDGTSLVDAESHALAEPHHPERDLDAYAESMYPRQLGWSPLRSLRVGRFKLIDAPHPELYDLLLDPFEQHNIYEQERSLAASLAGRLAELAGDGIARPPGPGTACFPDAAGSTAASSGRNAEGPAVSSELQLRLAALGYVMSPGGISPRDDTAAPDPKDCIAAHAARSERFAPGPPQVSDLRK